MRETRHLELSADYGEGFGVWPLPAQVWRMDAERLGTFGLTEALEPSASVLDAVDTVSLACGGHASDPLLIDHYVADTLRRGIAVGAHPGYPDLQGFGLRAMAMSVRELEATVLYQVGALEAFIKAHGGRLHHVKCHGALYHRIQVDPASAKAVVRACSRGHASLPHYGLPGGALQEACQELGESFVGEFYVDRAYTSSGGLVDRNLPNAMVGSSQAVQERVRDLIRTGTVETADGGRVKIDADTLVVHADSPGAFHLAAAARQTLMEEGVVVGPWRGGRET